MSTQRFYQCKQFKLLLNRNCSVFQDELISGFSTSSLIKSANNKENNGSSSPNDSLPSSDSDSTSSSKAAEPEKNKESYVTNIRNVLETNRTGTQAISSKNSSNSVSNQESLVNEANQFTNIDSDRISKNNAEISSEQFQNSISEKSSTKNKLRPFVTEQIINESNVDSPTNSKIEELEPPSNCCMSGCPNCVWIEYVEKLSKHFTSGNFDRKRIHNDIKKINDPNVQAVVIMELKLRGLW